MEGFILSHTVTEIAVPEQGQVEAFLPLTDVPHRLAGTAHTLGQIELPHQTECHRFAHHQAMLDFAEVYREVQQEFEHCFGRALPGLTRSHRTADAETLIVSMGSIGITAEAVVDKLRSRGQKIGALRLRGFRPLPGDEIRAAFQGKSRIAILDRNLGIGLGGVVWSETRALADPGAIVQSYLTGLGGGDVRPDHLEALIAGLLTRQSASAPQLVEAV